MGGKRKQLRIKLFKTQNRTQTDRQTDKGKQAERRGKTKSLYLIANVVQ